MQKSFIYEVKDYQKKKPFASFLSGVAGHHGIPLWSFFVNRGQLIASFGVKNKNGAIMEFYPANLAYHYVSTIGFKTFVKVDGQVHEFFNESNEGQTLKVGMDQISITEINKLLGLSLKITYFTLPNENIAGLVRKVELTNLNQQPRSIEMIDGLAQILPSGIDFGAYKAMSNLLQSWMVSQHEESFVYYKLSASTGDQAEVSAVLDGNFYMSFGLKDYFLISDYKLIFDEDTSLKTPYGFKNQTYRTLKNMHQTHVNQVPCAMTAASFTLSNQNTFYSVIGYTHHKEDAKVFAQKTTIDLMHQKEMENQNIHENIVGAIETKTSSPILDAYFKQCYLDNVLRGGTPWVVDTKIGEIGYYLYSRKHGDLERDYNFFHLEPSFYSQGNGNFRDVLQNRRNDIFFEPKIRDFNIYQFASLIQADGYNPLSIEGVQFEYMGSLKSSPDFLSDVLKKPFTPGMIATILNNHKHEIQKTLQTILKNSTPIVKASFGEGYWEDHFTYIYDLIESYLNVYPDEISSFLFDQKYPFFKSPVTVMPRDEKYVLTKDSKIRQYGAIIHAHHESDSWLKGLDGILKVNLYGKILTLVLNKYAHLDPFGIGLSYEADKPGWNDAANGIPGLFGSGVSETFELYKLVKFLYEKHSIFTQDKVFILKSTLEFAQNLTAINLDDEFSHWDQRMTYLETYRHSLNDDQVVLECQVNDFHQVLSIIKNKLEKAIDKAKALSPVMPTYLTYQALDYDLILTNDGQQKIGHYGLPLVRVKSFEILPLPIFLEAPARFLKSLSTKEEAQTLYEAVKKTGLYDQKHAFYQTSVSLENTSHEIGRLKAFTPGWLERESNFLHMTYKYLLGILKSGLYDIFYEEIKTNFTCFMDPIVYGRSPIENSSFIATSSNPDPKKHGQGFVSRLSGSTAEMITMWRYMFLGDSIFSMINQELTFKLNPKLPYSFFESNKIQTKLFNHIKINYIIDQVMNTYDCGVTIFKMVLKNDNETLQINDAFICGKLAYDIREKHYNEIDVYLTKKA